MTKQSLLEKSIEFAEIALGDKKRLDGESYFEHSLKVKETLENIGITDETTLSAAILHDTIKIGKVTSDELEKEFGIEITNLILQLDEIAELPIPIQPGKERAINLHKLFIQLSKDIRVLVIRMADRIENIKTCFPLPREDQIWVAEKAQFIYAPIAKAIGIYAFARTFEDEALKINDPERYKEIENAVSSKLENSEKVLLKIEKKLLEYTKSHNIEASISFRTKSISSANNKMDGYYKSNKVKTKDEYERIRDLLGIRVIVNGVGECYQILSFIHNNWEHDPEEFDDYIDKPKPSGYKSIQTNIKLSKIANCEVQIRTFNMHEFNEYGPASHFLYKYSPGGKEISAGWIKNLIGQKENLQENIIHDSSIKLFEDTIFVFTPDNELIVLPAKSTPVDFAYAIHTDIGDRCTGAKVNGKIVKLDYQLESGQHVEILTKRNHTPSANWLSFVQTQEAKRHIRKGLGKSQDL